MTSGLSSRRSLHDSRTRLDSGTGTGGDVARQAGANAVPVTVGSALGALLWIEVFVDIFEPASREYFVALVVWLTSIVVPVALWLSGIARRRRARLASVSRQGFPDTIDPRFDAEVARREAETARREAKTRPRARPRARPPHD